MPITTYIRLLACLSFYFFTSPHLTVSFLSIFHCLSHPLCLCLSVSLSFLCLSIILAFFTQICSFLFSLSLSLFPSISFYFSVSLSLSLSQCPSEWFCLTMSLFVSLHPSVSFCLFLFCHSRQSVYQFLLVTLCGSLGLSYLSPFLSLCLAVYQSFCQFFTVSILLCLCIYFAIFLCL